MTTVERDGLALYLSHFREFEDSSYLLFHPATCSKVFGAAAPTRTRKFALLIVPHKLWER